MRSISSLVMRAAALAMLVAPAAHAQITRRAERPTNVANVDREIRARATAWQTAIDQKRADRVAALYLPDAKFMAPNKPAATGRQIRNAWAELLALPGVNLRIRPTTIAASVDGTMAYEVGTYDLRYRPQTGMVRDRGKYVVVWTRTSGEWRVAADIFNSDLPAANQ
jgi:ketosteroid isomerase-like protein